MNILKIIILFYIAVLGGLIFFLCSRQKYRLIKNLLIYHILIIGGIVMMLPFYWMVITSFKSYEEAVAFPPSWFPTKFQPENFTSAWFAPKGIVYGTPPRSLTFGRYFYVSIVTGFSTTAGVLLTSALAAFAFAKMRFFGRGLFFYILLATMMVPGQVLLIPDFIILQYLRWLDKFEALIIPWLASVFCIFLMRQFFITIPDDLWDAAQIDGSGRFRFLWMVIIPLSKPVMITCGIFTFLTSWNSLLWPLIVTNRPEMRTLMVGLQNFVQEAGSDYHLLMAASTMAVLPIVVLFFLLQRFFIAGIARTGLKG